MYTRQDRNLSYLPAKNNLRITMRGRKMGRIKDMLGQRFGRLIVIEMAPKNHKTKNGDIKWVCRCECGKTLEVDGASLRRGHTKSCGCYNDELCKELGIKSGTHHKRHSREYNSWAGIKERCYNTNCKSYINYGGRGITICERWLSSFQNFLDDMGTCPIGLTLDRINNDGNYEPENCRWATMKEQANNKRSNIMITHEGQTLSMKAWAVKTNMYYHTLRNRYQKGFRGSELFRPLRRILKKAA